MPERLRAFLDRPLDPRAARAVLVLASAAFVGFAAVALVAIGSGGDGRSSTAARRDAPSVGKTRLDARLRVAAPGAARPQDPQDNHGSAAARAARDELRSHRALQHVPYRRGGLSIALVGARRGRAVLRVRTTSLGAARRGWLKFLLRYRDAGSAYVPRLRSPGGRDG